jgi:hydrogenase maturation protease
MWNLYKPVKPGLDWQIVGIGSYFNSDDEVGLALVRALSEDTDYASRCVLWEGADAATIASSLLEWCWPAVLVDAADMDLSPGEHRFFPDQDAALIIKDSSVSTHGLGLAEGLQLARNLGFKQPVRIFAVQPFDLSPRQGLTPEMAARFPALLSALQRACKDVAGIA